MTKEIKDKMKEQEEVSRNKGTHIETYKSLNEEVSRIRRRVTGETGSVS